MQNRVNSEKLDRRPDAVPSGTNKNWGRELNLLKTGRVAPRYAAILPSAIERIKRSAPYFFARLCVALDLSFFSSA